MSLGGELEEEPSPELEGDPEDAGEMRGDGLLGGVAGRVLRHDETILPADRIESALAALPSPAELRLIRSWLASRATTTTTTAAAAAGSPKGGGGGVPGPVPELGDAENYFLEVFTLTLPLSPTRTPTLTRMRTQP